MSVSKILQLGGTPGREGNRSQINDDKNQGKFLKIVLINLEYYIEVNSHIGWLVMLN